MLNRRFVTMCLVASYLLIVLAAVSYMKEPLGTPAYAEPSYRSAPVIEYSPAPASQDCLDDADYTGRLC